MSKRTRAGMPGTARRRARAAGWPAESPRRRKRARGSGRRRRGWRDDRPRGRSGRPPRRAPSPRRTRPARRGTRRAALAMTTDARAAVPSVRTPIALQRLHDPAEVLGGLSIVPPRLPDLAEASGSPMPGETRHRGRWRWPEPAGSARARGPSHPPIQARLASRAQGPPQPALVAQRLGEGLGLVGHARCSSPAPPTPAGRGWRRGGGRWPAPSARDSPGDAGARRAPARSRPPPPGRPSAPIAFLRPDGDRGRPSPTPRPGARGGPGARRAPRAARGRVPRWPRRPGRGVHAGDPAGGFRRPPRGSARA